MKNCKFCGAEMEDELSVCPGCGKDQEEAAPEAVEEALPEAAEETAPEAAEKAAPEAVEEAKKGGVKVPTMAIAVAAVVLVAAFVAGLVLGGRKKEVPATETTQATEETEPPTIPADGNPDDVTCKGTYTVTDEAAVAAHDDVIGTVGSRPLTNGQLQVHYWLGVQQFYGQYGAYAAYLGLDHAQPMDTQRCGLAEERRTWQQYFLEQALDQWQVFEAVAQQAEKNGFQLPEEDRLELEQLEAGLAETASANGFDDVDHMLKVNFGGAVTLQDYQDYWQLFYLSSRYYNEVMGSQEVSDEEIEAFFAENEEAYKEKGLTKDTCTVDVRHILIQPENPQDDGSYSEESWAAAGQKAQELLDAYLAGEQTEDAFAAMATEHTQDPGSQGTGGLYQKITLGQMVEPFEQWCFDTGRSVGDTGLVKTTYGYHVMYFVGSQTIWQEQVKQDILSQRSVDFLDKALEEATAEFDYSAMKLALVDMA